MKCDSRTGTYRCEKPYRHTCHVLGGKATWADVYDKMKITRVKL